MDFIIVYVKRALEAILALFGKELDPYFADNMETMFKELFGYEPQGDDKIEL